MLYHNHQPQFGVRVVGFQHLFLIEPELQGNGKGLPARDERPVPGDGQTKAQGVVEVDLARSIVIFHLADGSTCAGRTQQTHERDKYKL
jgi:hypothetical protein